MLAGRGPTSGAEEAGTLGASPCRLPCPEGPKLGIWVPGPLGAPRKSVQEGAVSILMGSAASAQRNGHLPRPGCAGGGGGVFRFWNLSSSQALSATWFSNRGESARGVSLELMGRVSLAQARELLGPGFMSTYCGLLCPLRQCGCQQTFHIPAYTPLSPSVPTWRLCDHF